MTQIKILLCILQAESCLVCVSLLFKCSLFSHRCRRRRCLLIFFWHFIFVHLVNERQRWAISLLQSIFILYLFWSHETLTRTQTQNKAKWKLNVRWDIQLTIYCSFFCHLFSSSFKIKSNESESEEFTSNKVFKKNIDEKEKIASFFFIFVNVILCRKRYLNTQQQHEKKNEIRAAATL